MNLRDLRAQATDHLRDLRRLDYIIDQSDFEELFNADPELVTENVKLVSTSLDPRVRASVLEKLRASYRKELKIEQSLRDLRNVAKSLGIPGYSKRKKLELAGAVEARKNGNYFGPSDRSSENSIEVRNQEIRDDLQAEQAGGSNGDGEK